MAADLLPSDPTLEQTVEDTLLTSLPREADSAQVSEPVSMLLPLLSRPSNLIRKPHLMPASDRCLHTSLILLSLRKIVTSIAWFSCL